MMHHHKYSLTEIEGMIPWERDLYLSMVIKHITEENEKIKLENQQKKASRRK
ncbi:hypothetical protein UFOVP49_22 [uncultured Caudovirales phage]|uniref:Baseplate hub assembly catalyst n=1 Tax=uncultured Caudovirales phage TaxID=2100421 RepID=A0A6J5KVA8_9CAUD|nr:hypothetical protein UFOVP49_22 [uncultured Caudovirales phage]